MSIENKVVSLKLAKKLKELGVEMETEFRWVFKCSGRKKPHVVTDWNDCGENGCPAPLACELLEYLPDEIIYGKSEFSPVLHLEKFEEKYTAFYYRGEEWSTLFNQTSDIPANALALLLIHIIEQKIWTPKK